MVPPKGVYFPISKIYSILPVANLLAHNNINQIRYWVPFFYRVLQLTAVFLLIWHLWGTIYFACDGIIFSCNSLIQQQRQLSTTSSTTSFPQPRLAEIFLMFGGVKNVSFHSKFCKKAFLHAIPYFFIEIL